MSATMHVVGLDVALRSTGWAAITYESGELVDCGLITTRGGGLDLAASLCTIGSRVSLVCRRFDNPDVAIEEGIAHRSGHTTRMLAHAWGAAFTAAYQTTGCAAAVINISTIKTTAGAQDKAGIVANAAARWPNHDGALTKPGCTDIADALWCAETHRLWLHEHFDNEQDNT